MREERGRERAGWGATGWGLGRAEKRRERHAMRHAAETETLGEGARGRRRRVEVRGCLILANTRSISANEKEERAMGPWRGASGMARGRLVARGQYCLGRVGRLGWRLVEKQREAEVLKRSSCLQPPTTRG